VRKQAGRRLEHTVSIIGCQDTNLKARYPPLQPSKVLQLYGFPGCTPSKTVAEYWNDGVMGTKQIRGCQHHLIPIFEHSNNPDTVI
jgi:hypothetical protein